MEWVPNRGVCSRSALSPLSASACVCLTKRRGSPRACALGTWESLDQECLFHSVNSPSSISSRLFKVGSDIGSAGKFSPAPLPTGLAAPTLRPSLVILGHQRWLTHLYPRPDCEPLGLVLLVIASPESRSAGSGLKSEWREK